MVSSNQIANGAIPEQQTETPNDIKTERNKTKNEQYYNDFRSNTSMTQ